MSHFLQRVHTRFLHQPGTTLLAWFCLAALVFHLGATEWLNASYQASGFPVPYHQAQLSFNPALLKGWYGQLVQGGTLQRYVTTQHIDSVFILSTLLLHVGTLVLVSRLFAAGSQGRRHMVSAAMVSAIAPLADQAENLVSYLMLANPEGFADGLAYLYSSLAALKFAMFVWAYLALAVGLLCAALLRLPRFRR